MSENKLLKQVKKFAEKGHITDNEMKILRVKARKDNISKKVLDLLIKDELKGEKDKKTKEGKQSITQTSIGKCINCKTPIHPKATICPTCGAKQSTKQSKSSIKEDKEKHCSNCGQKIDIKAEICPECGVRQPGFEQTKKTKKSNKSPALAFILALLFGPLGVLYATVGGGIFLFGLNFAAGFAYGYNPQDVPLQFVTAVGIFTWLIGLIVAPVQASADN